MLEAHFLRGNLAAASRRSNFSRLYDLSERLIPEEHRSRRVNMTKDDALFCFRLRGRTRWERRKIWPITSACRLETPSLGCVN